MRRLRPDPSEQVDLVAAYAVPDSRHVRANFVSSADGAVAVGGRSAPLSSDGDRALFHALRTLCDVVLVGAGTVRAENYGGAKTVDGRTPPIAVVSHSLDLDPQARLFTDTTARPIIVTCSTSPEQRRRELATMADVVVAGDTSVDLAGALDQLADRGLTRVLCEGGPHLLGALAGARLLDELCLTVAPILAGGDAGRIVAGYVPEVTEPMRLLHVLEESGHLFLRFSTAAA